MDSKACPFRVLMTLFLSLALAKEATTAMVRDPGLVLINFGPHSAYVMSTRAVTDGTL